MIIINTEIACNLLQIDSLKSELGRKETELMQLRSKCEACESKERDVAHYLALLKESIAAKDQQLAMQHAEASELRARMRDKEALIDKKNAQLQAVQLEKHQRDSDNAELRDQMDIKERKASVLVRKIDNIEEQLRDKEMQINTLRAKLNAANTNSNTSTSTSTSSGSSSSSTAAAAAANASSSVVQALEQALEQKERIIEKLTKDSLNRLTAPSQQQQQHEAAAAAAAVWASREKELLEQIETLQLSVKELGERVECKLKEVHECQNESYYLKDELESLKTLLMRKDSHVNSLECSLTQKNDEIELMEEKLERLGKQLQQQQLEQHELVEQLEQRQQQLLAQLEQLQQQSSTTATVNKSNSSELLELDALRSECSSLAKEVQSKEQLVQRLSGELTALKEFVYDFEEQKRLLNRKLEQQHEQFACLESQFEKTTAAYEAKCAQQLKQHEADMADMAQQLQAAAKQQQQQQQQQSVDKQQQQQPHRQESKSDSIIQFENAELKQQLDEQLEQCKQLREQLDVQHALNAQLDEELKRVGEERRALDDKCTRHAEEVNARAQQLAAMSERVAQLEESLRESVAITAERETAFAQQRRRLDKLEADNKRFKEDIDTTQRALHEQQVEFSRYQDELMQREDQLHRLEEAKIKEMNELLITK